MAQAEPNFRDAWLAAFREGQRFDGYVNWRPRAAAWVRQNLDEFTLRAVQNLLYEHVLAGGELDQVRERREGWQDRFPHHFDVRLEILGRSVYVETVLLQTDLTNPGVEIVNVHEA